MTTEQVVQKILAEGDCPLCKGSGIDPTPNRKTNEEVPCRICVSNGHDPRKFKMLWKDDEVLLSVELRKTGALMFVTQKSKDYMRLHDGSLS